MVETQNLSNCYKTMEKTEDHLPKSKIFELETQKWI